MVHAAGRTPAVKQAQAVSHAQVLLPEAEESVLEVAEAALQAEPGADFTNLS